MNKFIASACLLLVLLPLVFAQRGPNQGQYVVDAVQGALNLQARLATVKAVYNMTIWPNNEYFILSQNFPNVLDPNVKARIHPFGVHEGILDVAEYYYGLTPNRITFDTVNTYIFGFDVLEFVTFADRAFVMINYLITTLSNPNDIRNATQLGLWRFNSQNQALEMDLHQPFYSYGYYERVAPNFVIPQAVRNALIHQTCDEHERFCHDENVQYESYAACVDFLNSIPFGVPDVNEHDNVLCRHQHRSLTRVRPEVHCPHIGPSGGGRCIFHSFESLYHPLFPNDPKRIIGGQNTW